MLQPMAGTTTGRALHNAIINPWFLGANGQIISQDPRTPKQIHEDNCVNQPALVLDQNSIELSDLKNNLFDENGFSKQAVSFISDYAVDDNQLNGIAQVTENGIFVAPWMSEYIPNGLMKCFSKSFPVNARFNHVDMYHDFNKVYSINETQFNAAIYSSQKCMPPEGRRSTLSYDRAKTITFDQNNDITRYSFPKIKVSTLNNLMFTIPNLRSEVIVNAAVDFTSDVEIYGNNINCNLSDIADKLLFCLDDEGKKAFYAASPDELYKILIEHCFCSSCTEPSCMNKCSINPISELKSRKIAISIGIVTVMHAMIGIMFCKYKQFFFGNSAVIRQDYKSLCSG